MKKWPVSRVVAAVVAAASMVCAFLSSGRINAAVNQLSQPQHLPTVIIDAGHGGLTNTTH